MKVSGDSGAKAPAGGAASAARPARSDKSKSFDSLLAKKREGEPDESALSAAIPPPAFALRNDVAPVEAGSGPTSVPPALEGLVNELVSVAGPDGSHAVDIQFDSRTLQGLHVRVTRNSEGVSIQLQTASDDVARLLSRNLDRLQHALETKGVPSPALRIETGTAPAAFDRQPDSGQRDRREGGQQQRQGGRQNRQ